MQMHGITANPKGVHLLDGDLTVPCRHAGSYVEDDLPQSRECIKDSIANAPIVDAVIASGKTMRIDINDQYVSLAYSHADTFLETARQLGTKVLGDFVSCSGCSSANGRRMAVPWTSGCRSASLLELVVVDLSGERPTSDR